MWRESGATYPKDSWEMIIEECKEIEESDEEESDDSVMLVGDTMGIRMYCEAAAVCGQMVKMPTPDELPEGTPPLPPLPRTAKEAYEVALKVAEDRVNVYWPVITNVAEKLIEVGYLTGEQVKEIVDASEPSG